MPGDPFFYCRERHQLVALLFNKHSITEANTEINVKNEFSRGLLLEIIRKYFGLELENRKGNDRKQYHGDQHKAKKQTAVVLQVNNVNHRAKIIKNTTAGTLTMPAAFN